MLHIIYILIIIFLFYHVIRAYHLYSVKSKELTKYKDRIKIPYDIFSHYEKSYIKFYKWMTENGVKMEIIRIYEMIFKFDK